MERKNYLIDTNVAIYYFGLALSKESEILIHPIAATCLVNNCSLITNNIKDFDQITGLHIINV